jgi:hypothetical protein
MYYLKKLISLSIFLSPLIGIPAKNDNSDDAHAYLYRRLEADIMATRIHMFGYLKTKYESNLNEYNFVRLLEYHKLFTNLESEYLKTRDNTVIILEKYKELKEFIEKRRLTTNEINETVIQLNFLIQKLMNQINSLREIKNESIILSESWKNRISEDVVSHHAKLFNPINIFPIPYVKLSSDLETYNISILNAYLPGLNVFTQKHYQGDSGSSLGFFDNLLGSSKAKGDHEKKVYDLVNQLNEANISAVKKLDSQKFEIIKNSITNSMPENLPINEQDFNLKKEADELKDKAQSASKNFEIKLQEMKTVANLANKNIGQDLKKMVEAKSITFIDALNKKRDLDLKISKELDREAQKIILEEGSRLKNSLKSETTEEAYSSLAEVFQKDAFLAEKYLKNTLYKEQKDFLFNDIEFLKSYPINSWSIFIRQLFSETIPQ